MPSIGTSRSSSWVGKAGAPSSYTEAGPPESTSAFGLRARIRSMSAFAGSSSANTPHSRIRRAISCEYCPPKSRTSTSSTARGSGSSPPGSTISCSSALAATPSVIADGDSRGHGRSPVRPHPDALLVLELLALAHQRRRDHHLGPLEGADVLVSTGGHRGFQRPHQVEGAVVLLRRAEQDLLHRPVLLGRDAGAAGQRRVER